MAKRCDLCGRGPSSTQTRSHSNRATKSRHLLNLQKRKVNQKTLLICTSCLKKQKA